MQVSARVTVGAKREGVTLLKGGRLAVAVKPAAKGGAANARAVALVAAHFKVAAKKVRIVRGHRTPSKILEVYT